jgi:hypothetical protein
MEKLCSENYITFTERGKGGKGGSPYNVRWPSTRCVGRSVGSLNLVKSEERGRENDEQATMSCTALLIPDSNNGSTAACPYTLSAILKKLARQENIQQVRMRSSKVRCLIGVQYILILLRPKFSYIIIQKTKYA